MKSSLKRAFILNIKGLLALLILFCLQYEMNKPHIGDILWMVFLAEGAYWTTVLLGLFACKKLRS
ncbi:Uncharacterised protein [Urinicoccus massiliensis]|uniref:Uncharacterized protein n=1 Tax=Urinicoccus massiliensis TaxID=1723382 RepID=A0A8H2M9P3_9FIRM|nr:hypothetical protein [Urinicoccus massiliensis]VFB17256.1 Uncharacterised protein [Urinicoccus massiliensis]